MSTENNAERLSVTLKGGKEFDAPWVVLKGGSTEDVAAELAKLDTDPALLDLAARVATAFQGAYVRAKQSVPSEVRPAAQQQPVQSPPTWAAPQEPTSQPTSQGETKFCGQCGKPMAFKSGFNQAKQKAWSGYFCPEKGHPPVWGS